MNKQELNYVLLKNSYLEGGIKEACIKAKEFLQYLSLSNIKLNATEASVSTQEFVDAVKVLMAYSFLREDEVPKKWHCDLDCKQICAPICQGQFNIDKNSSDLCPYFMDDTLT